MVMTPSALPHRLGCVGAADDGAAGLRRLEAERPQALDRQCHICGRGRHLGAQPGHQAGQNIQLQLINFLRSMSNRLSEEFARVCQYQVALALLQVNAFVVKKGTPGFETRKIENKISLR